jgi:hypothetical protein
MVSGGAGRRFGYPGESAAPYDVATPSNADLEDSHTMSFRPPEGPVPHGPEGSVGPPPGWAPQPGRPPQPAWPPSAPTGWAPPAAWAPPPAWAPGWAQPAWPAPRRSHFDWSRALPTTVVAFVIAAVVLGGLGLDAAIASPSAGTVTVGGSVSITAAPGWVLEPSANKTSTDLELRKANAILSAEVVSTSYADSAASLLDSQRPALDKEAAQISYGDVRATSIKGHETSSVVFQAVVASGSRSGVIDGELICMTVDGRALVIVVAAQQGHLDPVVDDITQMLESVRPAR